jgi:ATP-dependent Clp protease adaptor protein ClpS
MISGTTIFPTARPEILEEPKTRRVPPHHVILLNDDFHSMEFVVTVLMKVFGYSTHRCIELMLEAHRTGRSIVWTGSKEVAELKVEQIRSFHEVRASRDLGPLDCVVEPAVG